MKTFISGMEALNNEVWLGIAYFIEDGEDAEADIYMGNTEAQVKEDMLSQGADTKLSFVFRVTLPDVSGIKAAMASSIATRNAVTL